MIDINFLRKNPDIVKESEKKRGRDSKIVDIVLKLDLDWRKSLKKVEELKHKRNSTSKEINKLKKQGKIDSANKKIKEMKKVVLELESQEEKTVLFLKKRNKSLKLIGNILDKSVPIGKNEKDNIVIKTVGTPKKFDFKIKDHIELGLHLNLIELDAAAKNAGARFYYLKNEAVLLDLALQKLAIDVLLKEGFELIWPPFMLNKETLTGCVDLNDFKDTIYKIEGEDLYLIGTSEHPLVALNKNKVLKYNELPKKYCGISTCFRREAGSHGRDDKGIFRVHQFNKVEQVVFCSKEESPSYFNIMQNLTENLFKKLELPFRVVNICSGDIGNKQTIQYDIEAWFPGQNNKKGEYREVTSCSNCTTYQSIPLNIKYVSKDNKKEYVHILNNTMIATSRVIAAILENNQTKEGIIKIPKALIPYMNGLKEIKKA